MLSGFPLLKKAEDEQCDFYKDLVHKRCSLFLVEVRYAENFLSLDDAERSIEYIFPR
jgi:hypothetical protein